MMSFFISIGSKVCVMKHWFMMCLTMFFCDRTFPTVEKRWKNQNPSLTNQCLPTGQELLDPLLNELGILNPATFQITRDSCQKKLQAPLFWIPFDSNSQIFWPAVVVECHQNRLLCGVPYLDQNLQPFGNQQPLSVARY